MGSDCLYCPALIDFHKPITVVLEVEIDNLLIVY